MTASSKSGNIARRAETLGSIGPVLGVGSEGGLGGGGVVAGAGVGAATTGSGSGVATGPGSDAANELIVGLSAASSLKGLLSVIAGSDPEEVLGGGGVLMAGVGSDMVVQKRDYQ